MTRDDAEKVAELLSDDTSPICTCEVCIKELTVLLQQRFPERGWEYKELNNGSCTAQIIVTG